jgi:hypothetical protein
MQRRIEGDSDSPLWISIHQVASKNLVALGTLKTPLSGKA